RDVLLASRPYLRLSAEVPAIPDEEVAAVVKPRYVEGYRAMMMGVRQAFRGPNPRKGMDLLKREEPNFRQAVSWAGEVAQPEAPVMIDVYREYLDRDGRAEERDRWLESLSVEKKAEVVEKASSDSPAVEKGVGRTIAHIIVTRDDRAQDEDAESAVALPAPE